MTLEEKMNKFVTDSNNLIETVTELQKTAELEILINQKKTAWQRHQHFEESELQKTLPIPRLEMRIKSIGDWCNSEWVYGFVYQHFSKTDTDTMLFIPISLTTIKREENTFESFLTDGVIETPFRDGVNILAESKVFNLPAYVICEELNIVQEISFDLDISKQLTKMIRSKK